MHDTTESIRRELVAVINSSPQSREGLEAWYGQVWDTAELARDFEILGFAAPFVVVIRKCDRTTGSLEFQHHPRFYYDFKPDA